MAALPNTGQPVWVPPLVPPLRVEGRVDPRVMVQEETVSPETGLLGFLTSPAPLARLAICDMVLG